MRSQNHVNTIMFQSHVAAMNIIIADSVSLAVGAIEIGVVYLAVYLAVDVIEMVVSAARSIKKALVLLHQGFA